MAKTPEIKLTREQAQLIHEAEARLAQALPLLDKLESCGADCSGHRTDHAELTRRAAAIRQYFGGIK